ncbi:MAG: asparagine synthetase B, partial [Proteobacteria bacterium]|nr:asparagine synthetase B [Pseudomonadota bacterium]
MSAIAGLLRLDGAPVSPESLSPALDLMVQYGRAARGRWSGGSLAFGCQVQHLTPEPESYPCTRGPLTVVADARLDGRPELCATLDVPSAERATVTDGELLLRAYERWGESCAEHLLGDFAFAIWNATTRRLFLARDHIGARPLYYWHTDREFAFATDLPALLAIDGVRRELDEVEVGWLLLNMFPGAHDNVHTYYRGVRKLPFGHTLTLDERGLRVARHWFPERLPDIRLPRHDDYVDQLYALVERAVADRLRTRLPVGAHLSGGLDSSSVAVLATRLLRQRGAAAPTMFSWSPPPGANPEETEHRRILAICQQEGLTPLYTEATEADLRRMAELDISLRPALTMGMEFSVQRQAAAEGIGLMLSGWGGDEGVSYNARGLASDFLVRGQWRALARYLGL